MILSFQKKSKLWNSRLLELKRVFSRLSFYFLKKIKLCQHNKCFVDILFTDKQFTNSLNYFYKKKNFSTNVLSFPVSNFIFCKKKSFCNLLGDIVFCYEIIKDESVLLNRDFNDHISHLFLHGLFHLFGFNHKSYKDFVTMKQLEVYILNLEGIKNPY